MKKWLFLIPILASPIIFLNLIDSNEDRMDSKPELGVSSILEVGESFVNQNSKTPTEDKILGTFRNITEEEILKSSKIPDLSESEKIFNNGIRLSADYNQASYDYSSDKFLEKEYLSKLLDFEIKYIKYMTAIDAYIGHEDILIQKNSMVKELVEIKQQITLIKNSENFTKDLKIQSDYEKFKKFLPSMFSP